MNPTPDPDDLLVVEELLADTEPEDAADLRPVLEDLRALAHSGPVAPSAAVQALLLPERQDAPISLDVYRRSAAGSARRSARRPYGRRRPLAIAVALTAAVGAGTAAAAAADEGFRSSLNESVSTVVGVLTGHGVPAPAAPATPAPTAPARPAAPPSNAPEPGRSASAAPTPAPTDHGAAPAPAPSPSSTQHGGLTPPLPDTGLGTPTLPVPLPSVPADLPKPPVNPIQPLH